MNKNNFSDLATTESIKKTSSALKKNGITVHIADSKKEAVKIVYSLLPKNSEVMTASSTTLDQLGLTDGINEGSAFRSTKQELAKLSRTTDNNMMQKIGAAPEYVIGSVHAVTEDGKVIIASNTGSQLPAYSYGSQHVIWVVSTKKIVKNIEEGLSRIKDYVLPFEDKRLKSVYGPTAESHIRKLLIINSEFNPDRINLIFVKEGLGF